ncbi:Inpp5f, partial [Symbiodinium necroappetens]
SAGSKPLACEAVLGILTLNQDLFLLVVTDAVTVVDGKETIQRVRKCEALPAGENSSEGAEAAATVTQLLEEHFYFSHGFDLTRRLQQRVEREARPTLLHADPRYVWNLSLCEPLLGQGVTERWFTPVMQGFVQQQELKTLQTPQPLRLLLVARRSRWHAGTRYNARGLDDDSEAANWVESEMLVRRPGGSEHWLALTQVRGSAPVHWEQKPSSGVTVTR